jgi:pimeloyl-ACP methyl ester carboxylesterase
MKKYLWTLDGGRLEYKSTHAHSEINWLFLPGGPGLGSEALAGLTQLLKHKVPGVLWHFDLPGDGSNLLKDKSLADWQSALMQAINVFEKVVLVAHSTPGMYVQTIPDLEKHLHGLVLIGSSPDASWREGFEKYCEEQVDEAIKLAAEQYSEHPTNETLRALLIAGAKYSFSTKESIQKGQDLFRSLAVNHSANFWSSTHFDGE